MAFGGQEEEGALAVSGEIVRTPDRRHGQFPCLLVRDEFESADVAAVDALRLRSVPFVADLSLTRGTFPRHGTRTVAYASAEGQLDQALGLFGAGGGMLQVWLQPGQKNVRRPYRVIASTASHRWHDGHSTRVVNWFTNLGDSAMRSLLRGERGRSVPFGTGFRRGFTPAADAHGHQAEARTRHGRGNGRRASNRHRCARRPAERRMSDNSRGSRDWAWKGAT